MKLYLDSQGQPQSTTAPLRLPPKERQVLAVLLEACPRPVSREELMQRVWPSRDGSYDSLSRAILQIRRRIPGISIAALYGHGYRLDSHVLNPDPQIAAAARGSSAALNTYLHAAALLARRTATGVAQATHALERLLEDEPGFAPGHVLAAQGMAIALAWGFGLPGHTFALHAGHHLTQAELIDPQTPGLLATRGWLASIQWQFPEADALFTQALEDGPHDAAALYQYGWHLLACGRAREARERLDRARMLRPYSALTGTMLSFALQRCGRIDEGLDVAAQTAAMEPANPMAEFALVMARIRRSDGPAVLYEARERFLHRAERGLFGAALAWALARHGDADESRQLLFKELRVTDGHDAVHLFSLYALAELQELQPAAHLIERAWAQGHGVLPVLLADPLLRPLRAHRTVSDVVAALTERCGWPGAA